MVISTKKTFYPKGPYFRKWDLIRKRLITPAMVPAIDYITQTIDMATATILKQDLFPAGVVTDTGLKHIQQYMRRLYRVFSYSYICHREIFDELEAKTHLCERFTKFARLYGLLQPQDIHIPDSYFEKSN